MHGQPLSRLGIDLKSALEKLGTSLESLEPDTPCDTPFGTPFHRRLDGSPSSQRDEDDDKFGDWIGAATYASPTAPATPALPGRAMSSATTAATAMSPHSPPEDGSPAAGGAAASRAMSATRQPGREAARTFVPGVEGDAGPGTLRRDAADTPGDVVLCARSIFGGVLCTAGGHSFAFQGPCLRPASASGFLATRSVEERATSGRRLRILAAGMGGWGESDVATACASWRQVSAQSQEDSAHKPGVVTPGLIDLPKCRASVLQASIKRGAPSATQPMVMSALAGAASQSASEQFEEQVAACAGSDAGSNALADESFGFVSCLRRER
mmetsp:Transcript_93677/g.269755  ORF Transcript_93677/g.269755 Transcript_93677/m.269755 type:complete len:326 (-) Transcript_93677:235-1212(-)